MQIDIQARDFSLTEALKNYVELRLGYALNTRYDRIKRVLVRLSDINGPRGGNDKCCQLHVVLPGQADVVIADTQSNLYAAIDRAADRASHAVSRKLARLQRSKRGRSFTGAMPQLLLNEQNL